MNKVVVVLIALAAAAVPSAAWAFTAANADAEEVMNIEGRITDFQPVDLAAPGDSPGDMGIMRGDLLRDGKPSGKFQAYCVTVNGPEQSECSFTLALPDGQLSVRGGYGDGINGDDTVRETVIGGTGRYAFARGYDIGTETESGFKMELHLKL